MARYVLLLSTGRVCYRLAVGRENLNDRNDRLPYRRRIRTRPRPPDGPVTVLTWHAGMSAPEAAGERPAKDTAPVATTMDYKRCRDADSSLAFSTTLPIKGPIYKKHSINKQNYWLISIFFVFVLQFFLFLAVVVGFHLNYFHPRLAWFLFGMLLLLVGWWMTFFIFLSLFR